MTTTQQLLDVLRDARDEGLWQEQAAIVRELDLDCRHVRLVGRTRAESPRYSDDEGDEYEYQPMARAEQAREHIARQRRIDWFRWGTYADATIYANAISTLVQMYSADYASAMAGGGAGRDHPLFRFVPNGKVTITAVNGQPIEPIELGKDDSVEIITCGQGATFPCPVALEWNEE